jgi:hypothetical protein
MSYLKKILAAGSALPKEIDLEDGETIKIVERPILDFGKREKGGGIGMHRLDEGKELKEDSHEFHRLLEDALRDGFKTIYIYNQGEKNPKKPHLYLVKSSAGDMEFKENL